MKASTVEGASTPAPDSDVDPSTSDSVATGPTTAATPGSGSLSIVDQNVAMCEHLPAAVASIWPDAFDGASPTLRDLMAAGDAAVASGFLACDYLPADGNPRIFNFYQDASKIEELPGAEPLTGDVAGHPLAFTFDDGVPGPLIFLDVNGVQFAARASDFTDDVTEEDLLRALAVLLG